MMCWFVICCLLLSMCYCRVLILNTFCVICFLLLCVLFWPHGVSTVIVLTPPGIIIFLLLCLLHLLAIFISCRCPLSNLFLCFFLYVYRFVFSNFRSFFFDCYIRWACCRSLLLSFRLFSVLFIFFSLYFLFLSIFYVSSSTVNYTTFLRSTATHLGLLPFLLSRLLLVCLP